jgi:hypothetical protein
LIVVGFLEYTKMDRCALSVIELGLRRHLPRQEFEAGRVLGDFYWCLVVDDAWTANPHSRDSPRDCLSSMGPSASMTRVKAASAKWNP